MQSVKYRVRLVQHLLFDMLQKRETTINVRTAIEMLTGSWNDIQRSTVTGCFRKAGFNLQQEDTEEGVADEDLRCAVEPESWPLNREISMSLAYSKTSLKWTTILLWQI